MNKITLLIDHPKRDLIFNYIIKNKIGENVKIDLQDGYFTPNGPNFFSRILNESLIVTPSYNVKRSRYITLRKNITNSKLIVFHSEQFITKHDYEEKINLSNFKEYDNNVDFHFVWGQYFKDILISNGVSENKILIVGNPKFEILDLLVKKIEVPEKEFILFISNFNYADFNGDIWNKFRKDYSLSDNDISNEYFYKARQNFIKSIIETANFFSDQKIIVRLHPGESPEGYKELNRYNNVEISYSNNLLFDLSRSKIVFQFTSSVIFESMYLKIPTFAIKFVEMPLEYIQPPSEKFNWYESKQIIEIIKNSKNYNSSFSEENWEYYFSNIQNPSEVISKLLVELNVNRYRFKYINLFTRLGVEMILKSLYCFIFTKTIFSKINYFKAKIDKSYGEWKSNDHFITDADLQNLKIIEI